MKSFSNNPVRINAAITLLFFIAGLIFYFYLYRNYFFYLVDDSGVEILQVRNFSPWPIKGFIQAYETDIIESFYGYFMLPFIKLFGDGMPVFKLGMGLVFAATVPLFFVLLTRLFNLTVALLVTIVYLTSAYTIWYPSLLLRNAFSPLFVIGVFLGLLDLYSNKPKRGFCLVIILTFLAFNTYSSLRAVLPAMLGSAFIGGLFLGKDKKFAINVLICSVTVCLMMVALFYFGHIRTSLLFRGGYMLLNTDIYKEGSTSSYILFFIRSFFLPVYENQKGFLAESTHFIFHRPMLNLWLYGFWALGLIVIAVKIFKKKELIPFICLGTLILSSLVLCLGGPSLKTHYALIPMTLMVIAYGINSIFEVFRFNKFVILALTLAIITIGYFESGFLKKISEVKYPPDAAAQDLGLYLTQHDQEFDFVYWEGYGSSIMRANYPHWASKSEYLFSNDPAILYKKIDQLPASANRVLISTVKDSPIYTQLMKDPRFCFMNFISNRTFSALFASCKNNTQNQKQE